MRLALQEGFGRPLGLLGPPLGHLGAVLGAKGSPRGGLGAKNWFVGPPLGSQKGAKIHQKVVPKPLKN